MSVISLLAIVQPSPLALGAAGIVAGITLETLRTIHFGEVPEFTGTELTMKGEVMKIAPSSYRQDVLKIRVLKVLGVKREPVNFYLKVNVPEREGLIQGSEIFVRAVLNRTDSRIIPHAIKGRTVPGGWLLGTTAISPVIRGREHLRAFIDGSRDNPVSGLMGAISLGERWRVDVRTRNILRTTGTYHLLAISGVRGSGHSSPASFHAPVNLYFTAFETSYFTCRIVGLVCMCRWLLR